MEVVFEVGDDLTGSDGAHEDAAPVDIGVERELRVEAGRALEAGGAHWPSPG